MEPERARTTESERGRYETDDALIFFLALSFERLTLRPVHARPSCTQSVPSRSPLRPERSEKRTVGIRTLVSMRDHRRSRPASPQGDNTVHVFS